MNDKIVIVDDEDGILKMRQSLLLRNTCKCILFLSPFEALNAIENINPAVVIADQKMPGMTGTEFLEKVKKSESPD
ncbi:hypothetical protein MTBBW1_750043 [Desulfamplus magnetovallimortis]|uniref:Response regulatory domain-containing protein n=1 Tax=Desulfamplus magnetovallimortis TaxID=1246637 RepID=A0A1W1HJH5_9BACT|nr:response regulator [Desulfamplus magnetovallimortis]SLM32522.1 hypothetical protein MTBBW1_750043 [Desulfamplus magnetovallimortis]